MKITWTIAALAGSVTLVNAQQSPRRVPPPATPVTPAPVPATAPRAERPDPVVAPSGLTPLPGVDWLIDPPRAPELLVPGQNLLTPFPPLPSLSALEAVTALTPIAAEFPVLAPLPDLAPLAIDWPSPIELPDLTLPTPVEPMLWDLLQGQGPTTPRPAAQDRALEAELRRLTMELDRADAARQRVIEAELRNAARQADAQDRAAQRELASTLRALETQDRAMQRENEQLAREAIRNLEMQDRIANRELEQTIRSAQSVAHTELAHAADALHLLTRGDTRVTVPAPWAHQDVADSAWRVARELFNRGEWGQAVQAFRALPAKYPNSAYAPEAAYYQAFSLFRIGGTSELREALQALEASKTKYPNARSRTEATNLATRIRGVLAQRGDAQAAAELERTAKEQGATCDREEQAVQAEALNALVRSDAGNANELITRVLARKDECAIPLRKTVVFLIGSRRDAQAVTTLSGVARNDPSVDVKVEAIGIIGRLPNEEGVAVLEELTRSDDERIQRAAIRALVRHPSARARTSVRGLVERDDVSERLRSEALSSFDAERATADDVAWLRALYARVTTPSLKARTLSAIVRVGGPDVDQWLVTIARDDNQPSEIRSTAMRRIGDTMPIADLGRLYDGATQQRFRSEIINMLGKRKEEAATEKLIDIVKNGTDPSLRNSAIRAITNKNDPKATQLLLDIINK